MRARPLLMLGLLSGLAFLPAAGAESAPEASPAVAAARLEWRRLAERAERLRSEAHRLRGGASDPGSYFTRQAERITARADRALHRLRGQPWPEVEAALAERTRVRRALRDLSREVAAWGQPLRTPRPRETGGPGTGVLSGRVTDARTGAPVTSGFVHAYDAGGDFADTVFIEDDGTYVSDGLTPGVYYVRTDTGTHNDELFDNRPCYDLECDPLTGTPVGVSAGGHTRNVNFVLVPRSTVSGVVLDAARLTPVADSAIELYDAEGRFRRQVRTGADGQYLIDELISGVYFAVAVDPYYLDVAYDGHPCQPECEPTTGTPIVVGLGATVTGIDFRLTLGAKVTGRVADGASGAPVQGAVTVYDTEGDGLESADLDPEGRYTVFDLPTGTVYVRTDTNTHANEVYDNIPCPSSCDPTGGTPVAVTAGQTRAGIDFALVRLSSVSGRVLDAAGPPAANVRVHVASAGNQFAGTDVTDALGDWSVGELVAGTYFARTESDAFLDEAYDNLPCEPTCTATSATPIPVPAGMSVGGINFQLVRGGWITGSVRAQSSGAPLESVRVSLYGSGGAFVDDVVTSGGAFRLEGLPTGTYFALADDLFGGYRDELYRELPCTPSCVPTTGTPIAVTAAQATGGVDFTLSRLGRITGRVVDETTGAPVSALVRLFAGTSVVGVASAFSGFYTFDRVEPGTYFVATQTSDNHVDEVYNNRTCEPSCTVTQGTPVAAALDAVTPNIDFALRRPVFADVPVEHFAWRWVEALYQAGVSSGCATAPLRFCPDASTSRAEMAVFLLRAKEGTTYVPPPAQGLFADLPAGNAFARWAEELYRRGVTGGCGTNPLRYCPTAPTTRGQMAPFLLLTREGSGYLPPPATGVFQDLPASDPFARWVEELVRRNVAGGCSTDPPLFCPGQPTTRAQMAVFLSATFALPLP
jgi:hypothetical protein